MKPLHKKIYLNDEIQRKLRGLKAERLSRGLTQRELAKQLGIPLKSWRCYESGYNTPELGRYVQIAEYFGWKLRDDPNCEYYRLSQKGRVKEWLIRQKSRYGYSLSELSELLSIGQNTVENAIYQYSKASVHCFGMLYELFRLDRENEKQREEALRV